MINKLKCIGVLVVLVASASCDQGRVRTGTIYVCQNCNATVRDETSEAQVGLFYDKGKLGVRTQYVRCSSCSEQWGNQEVQITTVYRCQKCGREYNRSINVVKRKDAPTRTSTSKTEGFCSGDCERRYVRAEKLHSAGEKVGEAVRSFADGLGKK